MNAHASSNAPRGFAGLSSLVSVIPPAAPPPAPKAASPKPTENVAKPVESPFGPKPGDSKPFWDRGMVIGLGAVVLFFGWVYANTQGGTPPSSPTNQYAASPAVPYVAPPAVQQPIAPTPPTRTSYEEMPPTGNGLVLTANQVRYCLSEDIRLETIRSIDDHTSNKHIANFNARVADFNSRCASYKYRKSDMERVRTDVESNRYQLQAQARVTVAGWR